VAEVVPETVEEPLERRNGGDGSVTDESDAAAVGCGGVDGAADLNGEADGLGQEDSNQNQNVLETCEERFHALEMIIRELTHGRRCRCGCGGQLFSSAFAFFNFCPERFWGGRHTGMRP